MAEQIRFLAQRVEGLEARLTAPVHQPISLDKILLERLSEKVLALEVAVKRVVVDEALTAKVALLEATVASLKDELKAATETAAPVDETKTSKRGSKASA